MDPFWLAISNMYIRALWWTLLIPPPPAVGEMFITSNSVVCVYANETEEKSEQEHGKKGQ